MGGLAGCRGGGGRLSLVVLVSEKPNLVSEKPNLVSEKSGKSQGILLIYGAGNPALSLVVKTLGASGNNSAFLCDRVPALWRDAVQARRVWQLRVERNCLEVGHFTIIGNGAVAFPYHWVWGGGISRPLGLGPGYFKTIGNGAGTFHNHWE